MRILILLIIAVGLLTPMARAGMSPRELDYSLDSNRGLEKKSAAFFRVGNYFSNNDASSTRIINISFDYESALGDDFYLIWSPLPLGLLYVLPKGGYFNERAVSWNLGYEALGGFGLSPEFDSFARRNLSSRWDLEIQIEYGAFIPMDNRSIIGSLGAAVGGRYHFSTDLAIAPSIQLVTQDAIMRKLYANDGVDPAKQSSFNVVAPLVIDLDERLSNDGHIGIEYSYRGFGLSDRYYAHLIQFYWQRVW